MDNNNSDTTSPPQTPNDSLDSPTTVQRRRSASDVGATAQVTDVKRAFRIYWASDDHMYWTFLLDSSNTGSPLGNSGEIPNPNATTSTTSTSTTTAQTYTTSTTPPTSTPPPLPFLNTSPLVPRNGLRNTMELAAPSSTSPPLALELPPSPTIKASNNGTPPPPLSSSISSSTSSTSSSTSSPASIKTAGGRPSSTQLVPNINIKEASANNLSTIFKEQQQQQQPGSSPFIKFKSTSNGNSGSSTSLNSSGNPLSGSNGMGRPTSPSPFAKRNQLDNKRSNRLSVQDPSKDIMRLMRFYFGESNTFGGASAESGSRFFTIAVHKETTSRDVGTSVEMKLQLASNTICVFLVLPIQSNGSKIERMLGEDESIIDVKDSWEDPAQTFFLVKETFQKPLNKRLSRQMLATQSEPHVIPSEWRRSTDAVSLRSSSEEVWKRKSIPIFLQVLPGSSPLKAAPSPLGQGAIGAHASGNESDEQNEDDDSEEESELDITELKGWVHWIPSADLEYIKRIGSGTYSKVYKGRYREKYVAIKTLRGTNMTTEQIQGFRKECDILSTIQSPYLISFYGSCVEESQLSMVVEYCSKGTLHKVINSTSLDMDWDKWFKWMTQVVEGVRYLHNMKPPMVHRDLKTLNILVGADWNAKLCDFGLTRTMTMTNVSTLGMLRGTMAYTAPEIYDGLLYNTKSDVYSLGVIMWEMVQRVITGTYQRPFHEHPISMDIQIIILTSKSKVRPKIIGSCPEALKALIISCWDENPDVRPTCEDILDILGSLHKTFDADREQWDTLRTRAVKSVNVTRHRSTNSVGSGEGTDLLPPGINGLDVNNNQPGNGNNNNSSKDQELYSPPLESTSPASVETPVTAVIPQQPLAPQQINHHIVTEIFDYEDDKDVAETQCQMDVVVKIECLPMAWQQRGGGHR
eukprot:gene3936-4557_t